MKGTTPCIFTGTGELATPYDFSQMRKSTYVSTFGNEKQSVSTSATKCYPLPHQ